MELILNVFKKVKPEYKAEYIRLFQECRSASLSEEACIEYTLYQSFEDHFSFMLFERWKSKEGHTAHTQTDHFKKFIEATALFFEKSERIDSYKDCEEA